MVTGQEWEVTPDQLVSGDTAYIKDESLTGMSEDPGRNFITERNVQEPWKPHR